MSGIVQTYLGLPVSSAVQQFDAWVNVCAALRIIELATVEPHISLHEQNSLTPASGMSAQIQDMSTCDKVLDLLHSRYVCADSGHEHMQ